MPAETPPADAAMPTDPNMPPADPNAQPGGDENFKEVQKLTGQLAQKLREIGDMTPNDIKYTVNSIVSAIDFTKLDDNDKNSIINKIESSGQAPAAAQQAPPAAPPMAEEDIPTDIGDSSFDSSPEEAEPSMFTDMFQNPIVKDAIEKADLTYEMKEEADMLGFDFCEAATVFIHDYNEDSSFMNELKSIISNSGFHARPSLNSQKDLEYYGVMIYNALVRMDQEQGSQGEMKMTPLGDVDETGYGMSAMNEEAIRIYKNNRKSL